MRITGLATGLDMDQIVKDTMKPYRIKVDETKQKREIVEMKQQLYRDVIKDSREFYNKYFDIAKPDSLLLSKNWGTTKFESADSGAVSVNGLAGGKADNYKVTVEQLATAPKTTLTMDDLTDGRDTVKVVYNGKTVAVDIKGLTEVDIAKKLNTELSSIGMKAEYSTFAKGIVIESKETGAAIGENQNTFTVAVGVGNTLTDEKQMVVTPGKNVKATIVGSKGTIKYGDTPNEVLGKNKVLIDGIEFSFNDTTLAGNPPILGEVRITGKTDTKATADKIVAFVNDYNILMEKLNTITSEKRNKNYMPLTEDQKKEMSESEIKLWNEKTKEGQLYKDSDVTRIANKMKSSMTSVVGSHLNLESIGIKPVADYQSKNGTFEVDIDKLTKALESNPEEVMNLFIGTPPAGTPENEKESKTGIFQKLKTVIYDETITVASSLIKKVGIEGSSTVTNNDLTKSIEAYNKKMADLEKDFTRREQALYSKYAKLEVIMNKYNNQQSMMTQQLGGS